jgi:hypothetical protein
VAAIKPKPKANAVATKLKPKVNAVKVNAVVLSNTELNA